MAAAESYRTLTGCLLVILYLSWFGDLPPDISFTAADIRLKAKGVPDQNA
jgi:hypothetical protein